MDLGAGLLNCCIEEGFQIWVARGGEAVVGVEAELVEEVEAGEAMVEVVRLEEDRVKLGSLDSQGGLGNAGE